MIVAFPARTRAWSRTSWERMSRTVVLFSSILTSVLLPTRAAAFPLINLIYYISYSTLFCQEDIKAAQGGPWARWEPRGRRKR